VQRLQLPPRGWIVALTCGHTCQRLGAAPPHGQLACFSCMADWQRRNGTYRLLTREVTAGYAFYGPCY
jgi:hypothetical protein